MRSMNSKILALGTLLFSANAAADLAGHTFADSLIDPTTEVKSSEYPIVGKSDINVSDQFRNSCLAMGALSALVATGLGAAYLDGLKVPKQGSDSEA
jgi:hypothetical protein